MRKLELLLVLAGVALLAGCASAPTDTEKKFFDVETNLVPQITIVTNVVSVTNQVAEVSFETNRVWVTNFVEAYTLTPNTNAAQLREVVAHSVGVFGPFGDLAGVLLGGAIGLWGYLRSTRAARTAGVLAQIIETGREVLQATPQGRLLDDRWKAWMIQHQAEQGVIEDVLKLLARVVDNDSAKTTAEDLLALMEDHHEQPVAKTQ